MGDLINVSVKIEHKQTGEVVKVFDCGTDGRKADRLERALLDRTSSDYYVYISYEYAQ